MENNSIFEVLNAVNVNEKTETKKTGNTELTYLSWPWAWAEVKRRYPGAHYTIWRDSAGRPYAYDALTGYMVFTNVTIGDESHDMWLPVMDGANNAMKAEPYEYKVKNPKFRWAKWNESRNAYIDSYGNEQPEFLTKRVEAATMFDVNKTIMRCLVKNLAMFGLGLYIYAGEDLPEGEKPESDNPVDTTPATGSVQGAQKAGRRKLKEIQAQIQKTRDTGAQGATEQSEPATAEQVEYIKSHSSDADYESIMKEYGANLENLTKEAAEKAIADIKEKAANGLTLCDRCGNAITGSVGKDGKMYTATQIIDMAQKHFGATYCYSCMGKLKQARKAG